MPFSRLKSIGFGDNEVKTYEFLLANGDCSREQVEKGAKLKKGEADAVIQSLASMGAVELEGKRVVAVSPKIFLQKLLRTREVETEIKMSELRRSVNEALGVLEPLYSESRFGLRLEELWQILDGLPAMETETVKMVSKARLEVCIMAERFSWYNKVKEELLSALDRKVAVKVLLLTSDKETEARVEDMKKNGISVRLAMCSWRSTRFTTVDGSELVFLIWAKKSGDSKIYYRPGYTKNPGLISVFMDSFQYLWEKAKPL
jgi:sugar-specific transcriptional regulator TrmB